LDVVSRVFCKFGSWLRWWWALVGNAQRCPHGSWQTGSGGHAQDLLLVLPAGRPCSGSGALPASSRASPLPAPGSTASSSPRWERCGQHGSDNMRIQAFLTAAAINLKRLAAALLALLLPLWQWVARVPSTPSASCRLPLAVPLGEPIRSRRRPPTYRHAKPGSSTAPRSSAATPPPAGPRRSPTAYRRGGSAAQNGEHRV
jgi:hypothetical protein